MFFGKSKSSSFIPHSFFFPFSICVWRCARYTLFFLKKKEEGKHREYENLNPRIFSKNKKMRKIRCTIQYVNSYF